MIVDSDIKTKYRKAKKISKTLDSQYDGAHK